QEFLSSLVSLSYLFLQCINRAVNYFLVFDTLGDSSFICNHLRVQVTPDVHFQSDLGLDSLDNVEILMALEEEFKLEIPDKEADKIDSCKLAIEYIHNHPMAS
ncbi:unnamed protein product, partial [Linum tenue]